MCGSTDAVLNTSSVEVTKGEVRTVTVKTVVGSTVPQCTQYC